jgi:hypothetical protein
VVLRDGMTLHAAPWIQALVSAQYRALRQLEEFPEDAHRVGRRLDRVPDRPRILVDLIVVAALRGRVSDAARSSGARAGTGKDLSPKKWISVKPSLSTCCATSALRPVRPGDRAHLQRVRLVPPVGKDVEGDLAADAVRQTVVGELGLELLDKGFADARLLVVGFVFVALGNAALSFRNSRLADLAARTSHSSRSARH